jgi:predicted nucleic acid-binding protein
MPNGVDGDALPERRLLVVEASAVLTLFIDPGAAGEAVATLLRSADLIAPTLLPFEVSNVLRRRRNAGLLSAAEAALAHGELVHLPIELWPYEALAARVWELGPNLSSYDTASVALAETTGATLVTCDTRIAAAPGPGCEIVVVSSGAR